MFAVMKENYKYKEMIMKRNSLINLKFLNSDFFVPVIYMAFIKCYSQTQLFI